MTANTNDPKGATMNTSTAPYPFRTIVSLILLAGNFLIAAIYFHVVNP